jgi:hypothetical protein
MTERPLRRLHETNTVGSAQSTRGTSVKALNMGYLARCPDPGGDVANASKPT